VDVVDTLRRALADRYAIERELGQGGMATVYLAEDLKHRRKVALKVLRPEIAATVGADRFAREIEVAARLQHPNILPLLDSGEAEGFFFYGMPYVEGESLRDRLARGGELPIQDAVRILMEVADALSHAHAHGVVHRDIKPGNVLLSGRHALVADFGVAKAVTEATGRQVLTSAGVALGTPAYMAPEQATADPHQDHRVDIYALGVLGYELLTGRALFSATTAQEMLAAHVTLAPDPIERWRPTVSPALAQLIMKCLAKKPADRWQSAEEVLQHLEPLATPSGGTTPTQTAPTKAVERLPRWARWAAGAAAVVIVALVAPEVFKSRPLLVTAFDITQITSDSGVEFQPAISPDGNEVAYLTGPIGAPELTIRSTVDVAGGGEVHPSDSARSAEWFPSWSADGQFVRFYGCGGRYVTGNWGVGCPMRETGKLGGAIRLVAIPPHSQYIAWSADGARVAFVVGDTLFASTSAGAGVRAVAVQTVGHAEEYAGAATDLHSLAWSPDGRLIAYVNGNSAWLRGGKIGASAIWVVSASGGVPREVAGGQFLNVSPAWLDASHILFVSDRDGPRAVYALEVGSNGPRGEPRTIPGVSDPHSISYSIQSRRLAYAKFTYRQNVWSFPLDARGPVSVREGHRVTSGTQVVERHDVSPDGRWLVFDSNRRGQMDLFRVPVGGGAASPITDTPFDEFTPRWSPDGREIAYSIGDENGDVMVVSADGGVPVNLTNGNGLSTWPVWSPSGLTIAFQSDRIGRSGRAALWRVSRDSVGGTWGQPVQLTDFRCRPSDWRETDESGVLCDTGSDLALISMQGRVIWRHHVAGADPPLRIGLGYWDWPKYSPDGRVVYVWGIHRGGRQGVWALADAGLGAARLVIAAEPAPILPGPYLSVGRDRLYLTVPEYESDIWVAKLKY
jgi:Tol biopolymer transport system component/tRNA A-37 threonylcarbamoyl transferase component Bud32